MIELTFILLSILFAFLSIVFFMALVTLPSKPQRDALLGTASTKDVIMGRMKPDFRTGADENLKYGFEVKFKRNGEISFIPNSTIADHALVKALET